MACFLVAAAIGVFTVGFRNKVPEKYHINWLNMMIWGTVGALLIEHVWHGEIVPWFPFLTAMGNPAEMTEMFYEMGTVGVAMVLAVFAAWAVMVYVYNHYVIGTHADCKTTA